MSLQNNYSFEIDFLPVGDGERSGDSIAMRWGTPERFWVAVVDGGSKESGERLVEHVRSVYGAQFINVAINTHPDLDHASGLSVVLENFPVKELWLHRPWAYPDSVRHLFRNGQFTLAGLSGRLRDALSAAYELECIARRKGIPIVEPFQGLQFGPLMVLSPTVDLYRLLIPHFQNTPAARYKSPIGAFPAPSSRGLGLIELGQQSPGALAPIAGLGLDTLSRPGVLSSFQASSHQAARGILGATEPRGLIASAMMVRLGLGLVAPEPKRGRAATWAKDLLVAEPETSEQNESSVVLYGRFNGVSVLLTSDAGRLALLTAAVYALRSGIDLPSCKYYQVPHHGSRHNVASDVLDYILGSPSTVAVNPTRFAVASVAAGSADRPRKAVTNAFLRRGVSVCATKGSIITVRRGFYTRNGSGPAPQLPFYDVVEDPDD